MKFDGSVVPIIDLTPALTGDEAAKQAVAEKAGAAARSIGFLVVSGHGVPAEIIERASEASRKVFDMSPPRRRAIARPTKKSIAAISQLRLATWPAPSARRRRNPITGNISTSAGSIWTSMTLLHQRDSEAPVPPQHLA
jgi:isopenicillin N synthase-like dioxygenase